MTTLKALPIVSPMTGTGHNRAAIAADSLGLEVLDAIVGDSPNKVVLFTSDMRAVLQDHCGNFYTLDETDFRNALLVPCPHCYAVRGSLCRATADGNSHRRRLAAWGKAKESGDPNPTPQPPQDAPKALTWHVNMGDDTPDNALDTVLEAETDLGIQIIQWATTPHQTLMATTDMRAIERHHAGRFYALDELDPRNVLLTPCPNCYATRGMPCSAASGHHTHAVRYDAYREERSKLGGDPKPAPSQTKPDNPVKIQPATDQETDLAARLRILAIDSDLQTTLKEAANVIERQRIDLSEQSALISKLERTLEPTAEEQAAGTAATPIRCNRPYRGEPNGPWTHSIPCELSEGHEGPCYCWPVVPS